MRLGYSFWGFLGPGITGTPDGGRSHRRPLIDGLRSRGHDIVFLQANRDLHEADLDLTDTYQWDGGLPNVDALFLEWRWPITGRNTTPCGTAGHTCDLHRQQELICHYTDAGIPTILWDKDRQLPADDALRRRNNVTVCEAALYPTPGATSLLFPVADTTLDAVDSVKLAAASRDLPLVYVGNQYRRDHAFDAYFAPAATQLRHLVAGKWPRTARWPHVRFTGRIPFAEVDATYRRALATILLLPEEYERVAQVTQRIFEAVLAGCVPLTPVTVRMVEQFTPATVHVSTAAEVVAMVDYLALIAGTAEHARLLEACLHKLDVFRLSRQLQTLDRVLGHLAASWISG